MKFRIFAQDVGRSGYSAVRDEEARTPLEAITRQSPGWTYIALPYSRKDLWPDGQTGRVSAEGLRIGKVSRVERAKG